MTVATITRDAAPEAATRKLTLRARTAADLMTEDVISIDQGAPLHHAVATLVDRKFSAAPVTDAAGRFVGAVAISMPTTRLRADRWTAERAVRLGAVRATRAVALALHRPA